ncbi:MAG: hypothetical protein QM762_08760 [Chryseolinea sp.]
MLDFAVIAMPRSGTSWAANWLTTEESLCFHDPMECFTPNVMANWGSSRRRMGVACTGLWMVPDWLTTNVRQWIILEREPDEIDASLTRMGLGPMPLEAWHTFECLPGERVPFTSLFDASKARDIWNHLVPGLDFDAERHALLTRLAISPQFSALDPQPDAVRAWLKRIKEAAV